MMFDLLFHVRPLGVFGLILAAILTLRALADLPTMIWLRPGLAGGVTGAVVLGLWGAFGVLFWGLSGAWLWWLGFWAALVVGLPLSREVADGVAFRRDRPKAAAVEATSAADALRQALPANASTPAGQDAWEAAEAQAEAARLLADLTGDGALAYRGHIYRKGAVQARTDFVAVDDQPRPWVSRWRSSGDFPKAATVPVPKV